MIEAIVLKALSKRRDDRYQSAGELERDIGNYLAGLPTIAAGQKVLKRRGRDRWLAVALVAALLAIVGAVTWTIALRHGRHGESSGQVASAAAPVAAIAPSTNPAAPPAVAVPPAATSVAAPSTLATHLDSEGHRVVDLMPLIDPNRSLESGGRYFWERAGSELKVKDTTTLSIPYDPPEEYDFSVEFKFTQNPNYIAQSLSHGDRQFRLVLPNDPDALPGFDVDGEPSGGFLDNPSVAPKHVPILAGNHHVSVVRVRNNGVSTYLDGKLIVQYGPSYAGIGSSINHHIFHGKLGIEYAAFFKESTFYKIEVAEISGTGHLVPPAADDPNLAQVYTAPNQTRERPRAGKSPFRRTESTWWRTGGIVTEWDRSSGKMLRHHGPAAPHNHFLGASVSRDGHVNVLVRGPAGTCPGDWKRRARSGHGKRRPARCGLFSRRKPPGVSA